MRLCKRAAATSAAGCAASPRPGCVPSARSGPHNRATLHKWQRAILRRVPSQAAAGHEAVPPAPPPLAAAQPPRPPEVPVLMHLPLMLRLLAQGLNVEDMVLMWSRQYGPFVEWQLVSGTGVAVPVFHGTVRDWRCRWLVLAAGCLGALEVERAVHTRAAATHHNSHPACALQPGTPPVVHITDPEAIRQAFEVQNFPKSPLYAGELSCCRSMPAGHSNHAPLRCMPAWPIQLPTPSLPAVPHSSPSHPDLLPVLGESSMVITEGEQWRRQREAFNPGFSSTFLRAALPGFQVGGWASARRLPCQATGGRVSMMGQGLSASSAMMANGRTAGIISPARQTRPMCLHLRMQSLGRKLSFLPPNPCCRTARTAWLPALTRQLRLGRWSRCTSSPS